MARVEENLADGKYSDAGGGCATQGERQRERERDVYVDARHVCAAVLFFRGHVSSDRHTPQAGRHPKKAEPTS